MNNIEDIKAKKKKRIKRKQKYILAKNILEAEEYSSIPYISASEDGMAAAVVVA